jgi:hypothetical protein
MHCYHISKINLDHMIPKPKKKLFLELKMMEHRSMWQLQLLNNYSILPKFQ